MEKRQKLLVIVFTAIVIIGCVALVVFVRSQKQAGQQQAQDNSQGSGQNNSYPDDPQVRAQLQAMDEIRKQDQNFADVQSQTDEEKQAVVQTQLQQSDEIRKADKTLPLTQQQIEDQLKQIDAIRNAK